MLIPRLPLRPHIGSRTRYLPWVQYPSNELYRAVPPSSAQALYPTKDRLDIPYHQQRDTTASEKEASTASEPPPLVSLYRQRAYTASELAPSESPHWQLTISLHYIRVHTSVSCLCPTIIPPKFGSGGIQHPTGSSILQDRASCGILRHPMASSLLWHSAS